MEIIHLLHERAANAALNARASYIQARLCASSGFAFDALEWLELSELDERSARSSSVNASALEDVHGSVFPGVSP